MFVTPYSPDLDDAATTSDVGVYVATHLLAGRSLFDVLEDDFVTERLDEHPFLLDELGRDYSVLQVLLALRSGDDRARPGSTRLHAARPGWRERRAA
jgi:hypothetical protein